MDYDPEMPLALFLYLHSQLVVDGNKNRLDPYVGKAAISLPVARK